MGALMEIRIQPLSLQFEKRVSVEIEHIDGAQGSAVERAAELLFIFATRGATIHLLRTWSCGSSSPFPHLELRFVFSFSTLGIAIRLALKVIPHLELLQGDGIGV
ncbi:uncharacterized protein HKW66_Vig0149630 [Vigna angularis]|uniref:Uncharacterized protein n=2 Tax=Phaseolus angularis TaxID=3914 RepID=A0A8T0JUS4_PHAAN|nr:uncharacterized protein HKW66_Vig0149630 [Vigna angularis]